MLLRARLAAVTAVLLALAVAPSMRLEARSTSVGVLPTRVESPSERFPSALPVPRSDLRGMLLAWPLTTSPGPREDLVDGATAIVRADGDCLRLRDAPGLESEILTCLPEGTVVTVLAETADADAFRWRRVRATAIGWVAERYLVSRPAAISCGARETTVGLRGTLPTGRGTALVVWGGGTAAGVWDSAVSRGCNPRSIWASRSGGGLVGFIFGAPDAVNRDWLENFAGGRLPANTPLIILCEATDAMRVAGRGSGQDVPPPRPWSEAPSPLPGRPVPPEISARAAVVVDEGSGAVLFAKEAHEPLPPASLTKIATAIVAIEGSDLDEPVRSNIDARAMPGSSVMGLRLGDCFSVRDLLYGLLLPSGNDAALTLAQYGGGSNATFVARMDTLLDRLKLTDSTFIDPHGLGGDGHLASAYDIAMLARYAMQLPEFAGIVASPAWTAVGSRTLTMRNVNPFLASYQGADGVKTGFTEEAGRTLVASATRDGHRVHVVLLNAPDRFADAAALLDWVFEYLQWDE